MIIQIEPASAKSGQINKNGQTGNEGLVNSLTSPVNDLLNDLSNQNNSDTRDNTKEENDHRTSIINLSDDDDDDLLGPFFLDYKNLDNNGEVRHKKLHLKHPERH